VNEGARLGIVLDLVGLIGLVECYGARNIDVWFLFCWYGICCALRIWLMFVMFA